MTKVCCQRNLTRNEVCLSKTNGNDTLFVAGSTRVLSGVKTILKDFRSSSFPSVHFFRSPHTYSTRISCFRSLNIEQTGNRAAGSPSSAVDCNRAYIVTAICQTISPKLETIVYNNIMYCV